VSEENGKETSVSPDPGGACPFHALEPGSGSAGGFEGGKDDTERLRQLVRTCQDAVLFIDRKGTVSLANPATCRMFGYSEEELIGSDVRQLMAEPYATNHHAYIEHYEETGERRAIGRIRQVSALRRSGEEFPIELSVTQLTEEPEDPARYGAFIRDVSEKVQLQGELMERERSATVGTTASMLVHEIGNPLNNMALQLQVLKRKVKKLEIGADTVEKVDLCLGEIERLSRLVQEFRALSGRRRIVRKPVILTSLVESVLSMMRISRGVSVNREFGDEKAEVLADADKTQQVLLNLFHNAIEAMPEGGVLTLRTTRQRGDFVLEVVDTGVGVPEALDVFEPFVTSKSDGTGLGLAICSEIVREHDGTLLYESTPGEGTTFRMRLPLSSRELRR